MYTLLFLGFTSFLFALALTPLVRNLGIRWGLVDHPDHGRKAHSSPVPRLGGVAIAAAYLLSYCALVPFNLQGARLVREGLPLAFNLLPAFGLIFFVGLRDDLRAVSPLYKFSGQIGAAILAYLGGVHIHFFGGHQLPDWACFVVTIFWLVLCTNAVNLIDGVDGLASGVGLFATATTLLAALLQKNVDLALVVVPLAGCLLGFLRYNFNPATIFLGDSGSLLIGFILGSCSVIWSQKSATILGMTAPLLALSIPLLDTALAVVRRFIRGQSIFEADRGHIHHRLLDKGLTPRMVALTIYGICLLSAILALCMMQNGFEGLVIVLFCTATWLGIQHLGYVEFGVAGRMFVEGAFRRHLNANIALKGLEQRLHSATTPAECWMVVKETALEFGFHKAEMSLARQYFQFGEGHPLTDSWQVSIPFSAVDYVELYRQFDAEAPHSVVGPYADIVRRAIARKLEWFDRDARLEIVEPAAKAEAGRDRIPQSAVAIRSERRFNALLAADRILVKDRNIG